MLPRGSLASRNESREQPGCTESTPRHRGYGEPSACLAGSLSCSLGRGECDAVLDAVRENVAPLALAAAEYASRVVGAVGAHLMAANKL